MKGETKHMEYLKEKLQIIAKNEYAIPDEINLEKLIELMLENIGSLDSELRDNLIYSTLARWIGNQKIEKEMLKKIINVALDNKHLFYKIDSKDETAVFTRSFSILIVALIIYSHRKEKLFNKQESRYIYRKVTQYFKDENDLRGYVAGYGWAHSVAHTADALDELAMCEEIGIDELKNMLENIKYKVSIGTYVYVHEEDERLVTAIMSIISRKIILEDELTKWIESFLELEELDDSMKNYCKDLNIKNFMRSLYFRLLNTGENKELIDVIIRVLNRNKL
ncbi:DUF2785 domain-containing protein [Senegalia massiliensis]|uniref:DUF2785 domain-containing protein n=1 Tax=Senegalia massiliensis TaxID=1720316 RepID=UPI0013EF3B4B|nr:DUF2785 domain-containing protein [Senegalia massiliensis]